MQNARFDPAGILHLCVDMQRLFSPQACWGLDCVPALTAKVLSLIEAAVAPSLFTRFIPPQQPEDTLGAWQGYWRKWYGLTAERIDPTLLELLPELRPHAAADRVFDKQTYGPWQDKRLQAAIRQQNCGHLVISGIETDLCVLATALGAIERGLYVSVVRDATSSGLPDSHDRALQLFETRFSEQAQVIDCDTACVLLAGGEAPAR